MPIQLAHKDSEFCVIKDACFFATELEKFKDSILRVLTLDEINKFNSLVDQFVEVISTAQEEAEKLQEAVNEAESEKDDMKQERDDLQCEKDEAECGAESLKDELITDIEEVLRRHI